MKVIENIKKIRTERGISRKEFAERLGIDESNVSRLENGKRGLEVDTLAKIAQILNLRIIDLFTWPDRYVKDPNQHEDVEAVIQIKLKEGLKQRVLREILGKEDILLLENNL